MRDLTADERAIVAGGYWSDYEDDSWDSLRSQRLALRDYYYGGAPGFGIKIETDANGLETVVVNASRIQMHFWSPSGVGNGGGGGGGGEEQETPRDTPCVTDKPTKHANILDIHQAAINLKTSGHEKHGTANVEWMGLVWKMPGGGVNITETFSSWSDKEIRAEAVWKAIAKIPDGAIIVGALHSDPYGSRMSAPDWNFYNLVFGNPDSPKMIGEGSVLLANIGRGITADPNGLSYVYDMKTGKIHVYDKSDFGSDKEQCHVNQRGGG
jgi:hypothetical protein